MIRIKGLGVSYGEVWYDEELPADSEVDIVLYRQRPAPIAEGKCVPFLSLVTDLAGEQTTIIASFGKDCRYKIRRPEARDELLMEFIIDPKNRLDEFRAFYDAFARQQSLPPSYHAWMIAACEARQITLSSVSKNGQTLVWPAYVMFGTTARLLYTGSNFRNRENDFRALIGRANRWLHWRDMLQFKEMGLQRFDWGGLFPDDGAPEHAGVNRFKEDFGGRRESTYHCTVPVTIKGRLYLVLRDSWNRLSRRH